MLAHPEDDKQQEDLLKSYEIKSKQAVIGDNLLLVQ